MTDAQGIIQFVNPAFERTTGYSREEAVGRNPAHPQKRRAGRALLPHLWETISGGESGRAAWSTSARTGRSTPRSRRFRRFATIRAGLSTTWPSNATSPSSSAGGPVPAGPEDGSGGLLAGGVAHDYNNMLSVILGYTELALEKVDPAEAAACRPRGNLQGRDAFRDITRQLLAFARKQTISPVVLDLNQTVQSTLKMLRRLIGEDIELAWHARAWPAPGQDGPRPDRSDPGQSLCQRQGRHCRRRQGHNRNGKRRFDESLLRPNAGFEPGDMSCWPSVTMAAVWTRDPRAYFRTVFHDQGYRPREPAWGCRRSMASSGRTTDSSTSTANREKERPSKSTCPGMRAWKSKSSGKRLRDSPQPGRDGAGGGRRAGAPEDDQKDAGKIRVSGSGCRYAGRGHQTGRRIRGEIHLLITDVVMPEMNGRDLANGCTLSSRHENPVHVRLYG
jgi:two-component system, cell cycle sensor histidine kinase and response regulator CckA